MATYTHINHFAMAMEGPDPQPGHWSEVKTPTPIQDLKGYPGEGMVLAEDRGTE